MNGYLLDTHTWLWVQRGETSHVSPRFFQEVEHLQKQQKVCVSAISVLEIARLVADGHYNLGISVDRFIAEATPHDGLRLLDLTPRILIESTRLPGTLHRDPADRLLAATAREHHLTLITRDDKLLRYSKQGHLSARKP